MMCSSSILVLLSTACFALMGMSSAADIDAKHLRPKGNVDPAEERLKRSLESLKVNVDVCLNDDGTYGQCDQNKFPTCPDGQTLCFNRTNRRDKFDLDNNPLYYIDYNRVHCYPDDWNCSSCSPGRWCATVTKCILDEKAYDCPAWKN